MINASNINIEMGTTIHDFNIETNNIKQSYEMTHSDAKHYVMWSGGTDSTLLLYELIMTYGVENIFAISYDYQWLTENKKSSEKSHRHLFKSKLDCMESMFGKKVNHTEIKITNSTISGNHAYVNSSGLPQSIAWLLSIPIYIPDGSYIYLGSIKDDDLTLHLENYHKIFENVSALLFKNLILREPYLYFHKYQILDKLLQYDLYDTTWTCELPCEVNKPCGKCIPCKDHKNALRELLEYGSSDIIKMKAKMALEALSNKDSNDAYIANLSDKDLKVVNKEKDVL